MNVNLTNFLDFIFQETVYTIFIVILVTSKRMKGPEMIGHVPEEGSADPG